MKLRKLTVTVAACLLAEDLGCALFRGDSAGEPTADVDLRPDMPTMKVGNNPQ